MLGAGFSERLWLDTASTVFGCSFQRSSRKGRKYVGPVFYQATLCRQYKTSSVGLSGLPHSRSVYHLRKSRLARSPLNSSTQHLSKPSPAFALR